MTIDEAIGRLQQHKTYLQSLNALEQVEAHQLGIEALRREKEYRLTRGLRTFDLLPGETTD